MQATDNRDVLLERMDKAFALFPEEAEKLSVLLAASSWTSYTTSSDSGQRKLLPTSDIGRTNMNCFG
jgi:hypothetical protein